MQKSRHLLALLLCLVMMFSVAAPASVVLQASAATASSTQTIKLNKTKAAVYNGKKLKLKVSGTKQTVKWYTTDQKIATVKNGVVTTKKAGTVKIAAKVAGQKLVCKVTVKPALVASTKEVTMTAGKAKKAVLTLYAADGDVACKIADPAIASYKFGDWNGKKIGLKLTGKKAGVTTATVTNSVTKDKVKIKITVKAKAQPAAKPLTASATAVSLAPGEVKTVTLTESPASQLALTTAQPDIVRCSWSGAWVNGASALTLTGLKEGKTTITVADTVTKQSVVLTVVVGCDHVFSDAYIVDQAATCTAPGKESTHCIICGAVGATREIPPVAHDYAEEYTIDVPSTCSKAGEQSRHCKVCGARTDIKPVEKAPHDYGVPTVTKEATCKEAGSQTSLCKICGAQNVETIPVKDHTLGAWTVEKAATCKEAGVEAATCSVCGSKVTREIAQKEHTLGAWTVEKAATCKEAGVEAAVCSVCNTKVTREIPATGNHDFSEWTVDGDKRVRTCKVCGYIESKDRDSQPTESNSQILNTPLCSDENIAISLYKIENGQLLFNIENKAHKDFTVGLEYLDFYGKTYYDEYYVVDAYAGVTRTYKIDNDRVGEYYFGGGKLKGCFSYYNSEMTKSVFLKFDKNIETTLEKGTESNKEEISAMLCEDENIVVYIVKSNDALVHLKIFNKSDEDYNFVLNYLTFNNKTYFDEYYYTRVFAGLNKYYTIDETNFGESFSFTGGKLSGGFEYTAPDGIKTSLRFDEKDTF